MDVGHSTTLTLSSYGGDDVMAAEFGPRDERLRMNLSWGNRSLSARLRHVLSPTLFLSVAAGLSRYRSGWSFVAGDVLLDRAKNSLVDYSFRADLEVLGHPTHRVKAGCAVNDYATTFVDRSEDVTWVTVDASTSTLAAYVEDTWRLSPLLELQAGMRGSSHQAGGHLRADPRFSLVSHLGPTTRLKASFGRYTQWINVMAFGQEFSTFDVWLHVDASLQPTSALQTVLGLECDPRPELEFTAEAYYTDMDHVTTFDVLADEGEVAADAFVSGEGLAYGVELLARRKAGRTTGWIGYCLSWTRRRFPGTLVNNGE